MRDAFLDAGYPDTSLVMVDLKPNDGDNIAAAEAQIANTVELLRAGWQKSHAAAGCRDAPAFKVDLVTHSMGAFSGRWYATRVAPDRVHTFVSIAGANHGTNALCQSRGTGNRQMCPAFAEAASESPAQVELNGTSAFPLDETPYGEGVDSVQVDPVRPDSRRRIRYFTIRIEPDEWITPAASATLDGADNAPTSIQGFREFRVFPPGNFLYLYKETHDELPRNEAVIDLVVALIADGQT